MNLSLQSSSTGTFFNSEENNESEDGEYCPQSEIHKKYKFNSTIDNDDDNDDDMPYEYAHVWKGPKSVPEEYYIAMHRMKSESTKKCQSTKWKVQYTYVPTSYFVVISMVRWE